MANSKEKIVTEVTKAAAILASKLVTTPEGGTEVSSFAPQENGDFEYAVAVTVLPPKGKRKKEKKK